jgi:outer membrane protein assembly factor BamE (lipoprotein component of BamABCDE complex)
MLKSVFKHYCCATALFAVLVFVGCKDAKQQEVNRAFPTEDEVKRFLQLGLAKEDVTKHFGSPNFEMTLSNNTTMLVYRIPVPSGSEAWEYKWSGFQVYLREGKVIDWASGYSTLTKGKDFASSKSSAPGRQQMEVQNSNQIENHPLRFHLVDEDSNTGVPVSTTDSRFEGLVLVSEKPDLEIKSVVGLKLSENSDSFDALFQFKREDLVEVKRLLNAHIGRRILLVLADRPIAAPRILEKFDGNEVQITRLSESDVKLLQTLKIERSRDGEPE